jgi:predicted nucleotidyltransferase
MSLALGRLADEVGVSERTMRRAVASEVIRAPRSGGGGIALSDAEEAWVRRHWHLVNALRAAMRTEPNVELAVLFGSVARGDDIAGISDVDLLIGLRRPAAGALEQLRVRLDRRLAVAVQLVPVDGAQRNPRLLSEILRDGRPLVDRASAWTRLRAKGEAVKVQAERQRGERRSEARGALAYFRQLAAERERVPLLIPQ